MTARQQRPPLAFCASCNARERAIVAGRCIVCGNHPDVDHSTLPEHLRPYWGGLTVDPRTRPAFCEKQSRKTPAIPWHNVASGRCLACGVKR